MKVCCKCMESKSLDCYAKDKSKKDGLHSVCKDCRKKYLEQYYSAPSKREYKNKAASERHAQKRVELNKKALNSYYANIESRREKRKQQYWKDPEKAKLAAKEYMYQRIKQDPLYKLKVRYRKRVWEAYRSKGYTKRSKTFDLLGCSHDVFKAHIETKFVDGMNWDNYGEWHVDHIIPFASAKNEQEVAALCHYTNLQPLWASDNLRKGAKLDYGKN